ncbi:MAG: DUF4398 domain-containing protein [Gammaproteobacteria bacterium]|nr:DUF4398 domain-containing protein [Gammaproteobacteria bacterium]
MRLLLAQPALRSRLGTATVLAGLLLVGCASTPPPPVTTLDAARSAIVTAERFEAGRYAAADLGAARLKLSQADAAVRDENMELASRLAIESQVVAELAYAKTEAAKAEAVNSEMRSGAEALREEMRRTESPQRPGVQP